MLGTTGDWLGVVYRAGLDKVRSERGSAPAEIRVRAAPGVDDLAPGEVRRVRVTVAPSEPGFQWRLYLRDFDHRPGEASDGRVWWRAYPGTWQPLDGAHQRVAEGSGRVKVDLSVRVEPGEEGAPRLRFLAGAA